jgi:hypothetical protein
LISKEVAGRQEDKSEDKGDDDIVLPTGSGEIPQDESLQHLLAILYRKTRQSHAIEKNWWGRNRL